MIKIDVDLSAIYKAIGQIGEYEVEKLKRVKDVVNETALNVQNGAKKRSPVDTGNLRSRIVIEPVTPNEMVLRVGTYVKYAAAVEFGTRPHVIRPKTKKALFWKGAAHPVKSVNHPGTRAQPFLFPAWEEERPKFIKAIGEALKE